MSASSSTSSRPRPRPLDLWASSSAVILAALNNTPRLLENAEARLKNLRAVAGVFNDAARRGQVPDVIALLLSLGQVQEALLPLEQLQGSLLDATGELRQGLEALMQTPSA